MNLLSINFNHDGSAVLLRDGHVAGYVNTERFRRVKKYPGVRASDVEEVLSQAGVSVAAVDLVVLNNLGLDTPEIVERYGTDFAAERAGAVEVEPGGDAVRILGHRLPAVAPRDHFLAHAAAAFYFSPFERAACFACDPLGSGAFVGSGRELARIPVPETQIGNAYHLVSAALLGFGGLFGAGKTMGLAPYGRAAAGAAEAVREACRGGVDAAALQRVVGTIDALARRFPAPVRSGASEWNAAAAWLAQEALETALDDVLRAVHAAAGAPDALCLSGGTALNSVANQRCFARSPFARLYLHPACGDDGTAIGGALYQWHHVLGRPRQPHGNREAMYGVRAYGAEDVARALARAGARVRAQRVERWEDAAADALAGGLVLGLFQGPSEIGPRALGNRSILASPAAAETRDRLNRDVKRREGFRPFAPAVLAEHAEAWFGLDESPFMLRVAAVLKPGAPAITHVDGTARVQTVARADNPGLHAILEAFHGRTGLPLLLNTSFNVGAEPIVETPADAVATFLEGGLDALAFPGWHVRHA